MEPMIEVRDLRKSYNGREAVRGISFDIGKGELFALLGPNGAGKSTTLSLLSTRAAPDAGTVRIDGMLLGRQNREIRRRIGVVFQNGVLDDLLTVEANLHFRGGLYDLHGSRLRERILHTAEMTGISDLLQRKYGQLSGGQRRRCDIARALLPLPPVLFLDEPAAGLDPQMRSAVWKTIDEIRKQTDMTILLTTHHMDEAARAGRLLILSQGVIAAAGTPDRLKSQFSQDRMLLFPNDSHLLRENLLRRAVPFRSCGESIEVKLNSTMEALKLLESCRGNINGFEVWRGSMEDAYLSALKGGMNRA